MAVRDIAESGQIGRRKPIRAAKLQVGSEQRAAPDHLEYIADLVRQLRTLAAASNQWTLAALLDLAGHEAKRQHRPSRKAASRRG